MPATTEPTAALPGWDGDRWRGARWLASPNHGPRPPQATLSLVVLHSISLPPGQYGGDEVAQLFTNTLDWDAHPYFQAMRGLEVSAHFWVRRSGEVLQFVGVQGRAWHAGRSSWQGRDNCNDYSVGIELEGLEGDTFEPAQYHALAQLLRDLCQRWPITTVVGHEHVAPGRKTDPGPGFDWPGLQQRLAGLGLHWPAPQPPAPFTHPNGDTPMGTLIEYTRPDGQTAQGWLLEPLAGGANAPGLVVIQEWWGLNEQIKGAARRFAQAGYRVLVPDLYRGRATVEAEEASHLMNALDFGDAASQDVRGAVQHLLALGSPKVGVTGYCMGGALTVLAATLAPEASACATWYGFPPLAYVDASRIHAPLLGHFATLDEFFPLSAVPELEAKLQAANVRFEFHRYEAKHAFANETMLPPDCPPTNAYHPAHAEQAWQRTLAFFASHLG